MTGNRERSDDPAGEISLEIDAGAPLTPEENVGVRATNIGSFLPEATYRGVPIIWFATAVMLQFLALAFLLSLPVVAIATIALSTVVSLIVRRWTFRRGMSRAPRAWKIATDVFLLLNWSWLCAIAVLR